MILKSKAREKDKMSKKNIAEENKKFAEMMMQHLAKGGTVLIPRADPLGGGMKPASNEGKKIMKQENIAPDELFNATGDEVQDHHFLSNDRAYIANKGGQVPQTIGGPKWAPKLPGFVESAILRKDISGPITTNNGGSSKDAMKSLGRFDPNTRSDYMSKPEYDEAKRREDLDNTLDFATDVPKKRQSVAEDDTGYARGGIVGYADGGEVDGIDVGYVGPPGEDPQANRIADEMAADTFVGGPGPMTMGLPQSSPQNFQEPLKGPEVVDHATIPDSQITQGQVTPQVQQTNASPMVQSSPVAANFDPVTAAKQDYAGMLANEQKQRELALSPEVLKADQQIRDLNYAKVQADARRAQQQFLDEKAANDEVKYKTDKYMNRIDEAAKLVSDKAKQGISSEHYWKTGLFGNETANQVTNKIFAAIGTIGAGIVFGPTGFGAALNHIDRGISEDVHAQEADFDAALKNGDTAKNAFAEFVKATGSKSAARLALKNAQATKVSADFEAAIANANQPVEKQRLQAAYLQYKNDAIQKYHIPMLDKINSMSKEQTLNQIGQYNAVTQRRAQEANERYQQGKIAALGAKGNVPFSQYQSVGQTFNNYGNEAKKILDNIEKNGNIKDFPPFGGASNAAAGAGAGIGAYFGGAKGAAIGGGLGKALGSIIPASKEGKQIEAALHSLAEQGIRIKNPGIKRVTPAMIEEELNQIPAGMFMSDKKQAINEYMNKLNKVQQENSQRGNFGGGSSSTQETPDQEDQD